MGHRRTRCSLFRADRRLHDEACAEFALRVDCLQVGKEGLCGRFADQFDMNEHGHLMNNEGTPEGVRVQIVGVSQEGLSTDIFETGGMKVARKV